MGSNLIGATCERPGFDERGAIRVAAKEAEEGFGRKAIGVYLAGAGAGGLGGDGGFAGKFLRRRVAVDARQIIFFNLAALELWLHEFRKIARAGENKKSVR
jgi:hypothetical protein